MRVAESLGGPASCLCESSRRAWGLGTVPTPGSLLERLKRVLGVPRLHPGLTAGPRVSSTWLLSPVCGTLQRRAFSCV